MENFGSESEVIAKTFDLSTRRQGKISFNPKLRIYTQEIALKSSSGEESKTLHQVTREVVTKSFRQGTPDMSRTQTFRQTELGVLDLQVVIDNSGSMKEEQVNLATKLAPLLSAIQTSDWRINITTTDPKDGCSRGLIKRGDADPQRMFEYAVNAGIKGDGNEQGIRMAVEGLSCAAKPWVRSGSSVAVLFVSDEDNCSSDGVGCVAPFNSENYLTNYISGAMARKLGVDARVYALIRIPGAKDCATGLNEGRQYQRAVTSTQGKVGSVCASDYAATLTAMSYDMAAILKNDFMLNDVPNPGSLSIKINGQLVTGGYSLKDQLVHFNQAPTYGSEISVSYNIGTSAPMLSRFPLGESPAMGTLKVMVNEVLQNASSYILDRSSHEIEFLDQPKAGAKISASFEKDTSLDKKFLLDARAVAGTIVVKVNRTETKNFSLDSSGNLVFNEPPPSGATIDARYQAKYGPVLSYPVSLSGLEISLVGVEDSQNGAKIGASLVDGKIQIPFETFVENKILVVRYKNESSGLHTVELPEDPIEGSVVVKPTAGTCESKVRERLVELTCATTDGAPIDLNWVYAVPRINTLTLDGVADPENGVWRVELNGVGVPPTAFRRRGASIELVDEPGANAIVTVTFSRQY